MKTTSTATSPSVYVGTYAKYNNGSIKGAWVPLDGHDKESFYEACRELHADESDPEFMFQTFEGFPRAFYGESSLDEKLWEWLEKDDDEKKLWAMGMEAIGDDAEYEYIRERSAGCADSVEDFAEEFARETDSIPKDMPSWIVIDWEASWNCNLRYDYCTATDDEGTIWFFNN